MTINIKQLIDAFKWTSVNSLLYNGYIKQRTLKIWALSVSYKKKAQDKATTRETVLKWNYKAFITIII